MQTVIDAPDSPRRPSFTGGSRSIRIWALQPGFDDVTAGCFRYDLPVRLSSDGGCYPDYIRRRSRFPFLCICVPYPCCCCSWVFTPGTGCIRASE